MHFGCVELVEQHSSTHATRRVRLARQVRHDKRDRRNSQLSSLCNLWYVSFSLIYWIILEFNLFYLTDQLGFLCKSIKTTKRVQASSTACLSSAMLEQHSSTRSTRSSRLARHVEPVESCRYVTWRVKWNLGFRLWILRSQKPRSQRRMTSVRQTHNYLPHYILAGINYTIRWQAGAQSCTQQHNRWESNPQPVLKWTTACIFSSMRFTLFVQQLRLGFSSDIASKSKCRFV